MCNYLRGNCNLGMIQFYDSEFPEHNFKQFPPQSHQDHVEKSSNLQEQESPADAGIPARRKNDEKNSSISKL